MAIRVPSQRVAQSDAYASLDDRMLVLDFQAGEPEAFVEIHRRYAGLARHVCGRFLPNPQDADEAFQETMIRVFQGLHRFNGRFALQPWISRIATNVSLDLIRGRNRRPKVDDRSLDEHERADTEDGPEEAVERLVRRDLVLTVLAEMPDTHRRAIVLRELEGLSHKEIAEELDLTPAQAKALIHRAKGTFRRGWMRAVADRGGVMGLALAPAVFVMNVLGGVRRVAERLVLSVGTADVVTTTASSASAAPAATITAERVVAAATITALIAGGVTVGAVTLRHAGTDKADKHPAAVAAPAPPAPVTPSVAPQRPEKQTQHDGRAKPKEDTAPAAEVTPGVSAAPPPSPSPTATETPPPSVSPVPPPPAPAWSGVFSWSVFEGEAKLSQVSTRVEGSVDRGFLFSQATTGSLTGDDGTDHGLYLEYWGSANGGDGTSDMWIFVDAADGRYRYDGSLSLTAATLADDGTSTFVFEGDYALADEPESTDDVVMPRGGAVTLVLRLWSDGTSLYETELSLQESAAES